MEEELGDARGKKAVEDAVATAFGVPLTVTAMHGAGGGDSGGAANPSDSPLVRAAMAMGARIIDASADSPKKPDGTPENSGNPDNGAAS